jgi:hypothetical protein
MEWEMAGESKVQTLRDTATRMVTKTKSNSVALVRKRTIPTEQPPLVGEISRVLRGQRNEFPQPLISGF